MFEKVPVMLIDETLDGITSAEQQRHSNKLWGTGIPRTSIPEASHQRAASRKNADPTPNTCAESCHVTPRHPDIARSWPRIVAARRVECASSFASRHSKALRGWVGS